MFARIFRILFTVAIVAVAVVVVINRDSYKSMIPDEYNPLVRVAEPKAEPVVEPIEEPSGLDSLVVIDSLK